MQVGSNLYNSLSSYVTLNTEPSKVVEEKQAPQKTEQSDTKNSEAKDEKKESTSPNKLTLEEQEQVKELQARDTEVRAHEAAHQAAGGGLTGGANLTYQRGPDGRMYAIGGEVSISFKEGATPEESVQIARQVQAAAMAPANPSPQDHAVAASARVMEMKAQQQIAKEAQEEATGKEAYAKASNEQNLNYAQQSTDESHLDISA
jgi:hypothetical protein